jgi:carboxymethylenebutenolidase
MPLVSVTSTVLHKKRDGRQFDGMLFRPDVAKAPAILLLPEMFGLTPAMHASAERFAREGNVTLVPNVFWRAHEPSTLSYDGQHEAAYRRVAELDMAKTIEDLDIAAQVLRATAQTHAIVAIGHCIGGRLAVLASSRLNWAGAVSYYGMGLSEYPDDLRAIRQATQLHYGLADRVVPIAEVDAVTTMTAGHPQVEVWTYDGAGHSFCNPDRPMYHRDKAELVHTRTRHLIESIGAAAQPTAPA